LVAIPGLDKIDTHIYNLQPGVNQLGEVTIAGQMLIWLMLPAKVSPCRNSGFINPSTLVGLTENGDSLSDIRVRDMFSFLGSPRHAGFSDVIGFS